MSVPCWGPALGGDVPDPPAHSSQPDILVDPIFIHFGPGSPPVPQFIPPRGSSPPTLHLPAVAPPAELCFLVALRRRAERDGLRDVDCNWHGASGARIRVNYAWFLCHFARLCSWPSFSVCRWGALSLLYVENFGLFSQALGLMRLCSVAHVPQSVHAQLDACLPDSAAVRLVGRSVSRVRGLFVARRAWHPLACPELCFPPRMPQLCPLSPSLPAPLSSLPARRAAEVAWSASLSLWRFQPPNNFVFLCGLTLPAIASAGPRDGDSMSWGENPDADTGIPSQHTAPVRRSSQWSTGCHQQLNAWVLLVSPVFSTVHAASLRSWETSPTHVPGCSRHPNYPGANSSSWRNGIN